MLGIAHREQRKNVSGTQTLPDGLRGISAVTQNAVRPTTGATSHPLQWRYRFDK